jgi:hypothetical protein
MPAPGVQKRRVLRLVAPALALGLAAAPGTAAPQAAQAPAPPKTAAPAPKPSAPRAGLVRTKYEEPKNPAHRALYERFRDRKFLEPFADVLGSIRLPYPITLKFAGCDGTENAWFDTGTHDVTFCYEFVEAFVKAADGAAKYGISRDDAIDGPTAFVLLHESGHALFSVLKVPVLGREEDAADQVAAFTLLRAGPGIAKRVLAGAAWMYKHDASARKLDDDDFADVHGLDAQRLYNVLCMAYGSDPAAYAPLVEKGYLPKDRAEGCDGEYEQVRFAVQTLVSKSLDPKAVQKTRERHFHKWEAPAAAKPTKAE